MAQRFLSANPENASILELKEVARVGSIETALRCTAIQMLIVGISREQVCQALLVTDRALRKWINAFNRRGVDGLIANKRPGRSALIGAEKAEELATVVEHPVQAGRTFWTAKAFHGYISEAYQIECSYETVLRFFHRQGYALKVPQPWPDRQDEAQREIFRQRLKELCAQPDVDVWFADESIEVYSGRAAEAQDPDEKALYDWLAQWEAAHLNFLAKLDRELTEEIWNDNGFWPF